jgi:phospholipid N-methyltransferase
VDAIVSSLGLSVMGDAQRRAIIDQAAKCLQSSGLMSQYQYLHAGGDPSWLRNVGLPQFSAERFLKQYFRSVRTEKVFLNLPPARVFICRD